MKDDEISKRKLRKLNTRQRKKRGVAEFKRYFFEVQVSFTHKLSAEEYQQFLRQYEDKIKAMKLLSLFGNHVSPDAGAGVISVDARYGSPTPEQRQQVIDWLKSHQHIKNLEAGELR
jgi:uncharacterized protein